MALEVFLDGGLHTRSEIAGAVGQSAPTAAGHIDALLERGLIEPVDGDGDRQTPGSRGNSRGRPATSFRLRPERALALGMELRPSFDGHSPAHLTSRVIRIDGAVVTERRIDLPTEALRRIRSVVLEEARRVIAGVEHGSEPGGAAVAAGAPIVGVGLALPGVVDCEEQLLIHAPNLFLSRVPFGGLAGELGRPVYVDNEANAAALAEYVLWGRAPGAAAAEPQRGEYPPVQPPSGSFVRISITEGVGAGIIVDGRLARGDTWRAGEFGHMAIRDGSRRCNCGRTGCWEQYVSERALLHEARSEGLPCGDVGSFIELLVAESRRGPDRRGSGGGRRHAVGQGGWHAQPTAGPYGGGSPVGRVWNRYIDSLAVGIENVAACLDPGTIIVGGDVAAAGELLVAPLRQAVEAVSFLTSGIRVTGSVLPASAPVTGAALLAFGALYPASWGDRPPGAGAGVPPGGGDQGGPYASTFT